MENCQHLLTVFFTGRTYFPSLILKSKNIYKDDPTPQISPPEKAVSVLIAPFSIGHSPGEVLFLAGPYCSQQNFSQSIAVRLPICDQKNCQHPLTVFLRIVVDGDVFSREARLGGPLRRASGKVPICTKQAEARARATDSRSTAYTRPCCAVWACSPRRWCARLACRHPSEASVCDGSARSLRLNS